MRGGSHILLRGGVFIALDEKSALVSPREVILQLYTKALARWSRSDKGRPSEPDCATDCNLHETTRKYIPFLLNSKYYFLSKLGLYFLSKLIPSIFLSITSPTSNGMEERPRRTIACLPPHRSVGCRRTPPPASAVVASVPARRQSRHRSSSASAAAAAAPGVSRQVSSAARWP